MPFDLVTGAWVPQKKSFLDPPPIKLDLISSSAPLIRVDPPPIKLDPLPKPKPLVPLVEPAFVNPSLTRVGSGEGSCRQDPIISNTFCDPAPLPAFRSDTGLDTFNHARSSSEGACRMAPEIRPMHCNAFPLPPYNCGGA